MLKRTAQLIFFSNYFTGVLAVSLAVETAFQLHIPPASPVFYLMLFCATVLYYTHPYTIPRSGHLPGNPRTRWYAAHRSFWRISQPLLLILFIPSFLWLSITRFLLSGPLLSPLRLLALAALLATASYNKLIPGLKANLRDIGWLKPWTVGFVWAVMVTTLPLILHQTGFKSRTADPPLSDWYFINNWMFFTVNAIIFDIKDYATDANGHLKTLVVRIGLRRVIFSVLIPLVVTGLLLFLAIAWRMEFPPFRVFLNVIPFAALLAAIYSMRKRKNILYYLIAIDGILLLKAACGILGETLTS